MSKKTFKDLKNEIELKDGEIEELSMKIDLLNEEVNKLKLYSTKLFHIFGSLAKSFLTEI